MKEPSKFEMFLYRLSDRYWAIWHKLGRHKWVQEFTKDIQIVNGVMAHQDGTPPEIKCDICDMPMTTKSTNPT